MEDKKDNELDDQEELKNLQCKLNNLNNNIEDFDLPLSIYEFRTKVKQLFQIESMENDEILINYIFVDKKKKEQQLVEVVKDEDYKKMLKRISDNVVKDKLVYVETDKAPSEISDKIPSTFEEEIQCVIINELNAASERIKKYLSGKKKLYQKTKNQERTCSKCGKVIIGDIYRSVISMEKNIFCQGCIQDSKEPAFIIH